MEINRERAHQLTDLPARLQVAYDDVYKDISIRLPYANFSTIQEDPGRQPLKIQEDNL